MLTKIRNKKQEKGFSLLELAVAVGIAAIVAAVGVTASTVFVNGSQTKADNYEASADNELLNAKASFDALYSSDPVSAPAAPASLTLGAVGGTEAAISWSAPEGIVDNYIVSVNGGAGITLDSDTLSYDIVGLNYETLYNITVTAVNIVGPSTAATVSFTTSPPPFFLASNGVTVMCPGVSVGGTFTLNGVTYTKRDRAGIIANKLASATTCTTGVTDMSSLLGGNTGFNINIGHWDTSSVTNMSGMLWGQNQFNQPIGSWDVSKVTNMAYMLGSDAGGGAAIFNQNLSGWNVSSVTNMDRMFKNFGSYNHNLSGWNVNNVTVYTQFGFEANSWPQNSRPAKMRNM